MWGLPVPSTLWHWGSKIHSHWHELKLLNSQQIQQEDLNSATKEKRNTHPPTVMPIEAGDLELNMHREEQMICLEIMNWNSWNTVLSVGV